MATNGGSIFLHVQRGFSQWSEQIGKVEVEHQSRRTERLNGVESWVECTERVLVRRVR